MPYTFDDFTPILIFSEPSAAIVVRADSPWKTMKDLGYEGKSQEDQMRRRERYRQRQRNRFTGDCPKERIDWIYVPMLRVTAPALPTY
jgi:hypothetical protein